MAGDRAPLDPQGRPAGAELTEPSARRSRFRPAPRRRLRAPRFERPVEAAVDEDLEVDDLAGLGVDGEDADLAAGVGGDQPWPGITMRRARTPVAWRVTTVLSPSSTTARSLSMPTSGKPSVPPGPISSCLRRMRNRNSPSLSTEDLTVPTMVCVTSNPHVVGQELVDELLVDLFDVELVVEVALALGLHPRRAIGPAATALGHRLARAERRAPARSASAPRRVVPLPSPRTTASNRLRPCPIPPVRCAGGT